MVRPRVVPDFFRILFCNALLLPFIRPFVRPFVRIVALGCRVQQALSGLCRRLWQRRWFSTGNLGSSVVKPHARDIHDVLRVVREHATELTMVGGCVAVVGTVRTLLEIT